MLVSMVQNGSMHRLVLSKLNVKRCTHRIVIRIEGAITCGFKLKAKLATSLKATLL